MTREEYSNEILKLSDGNKQLMLHLPTSFGKSKLAIDIIKRHLSDKILGCNVLIVIPKLVLIDNWKKEMEKWEFPQHINVVFTTYISFPKHAAEFWDMIILDEAHHFTENCENAAESFHYNRILAMSATIPKEPRWRLRAAFNRLYEYKVSAREAIDNNILPDPKVLLIPMMLDNYHIDQTLVIRKSKGGTPIKLNFQQRGQAFHYPTKRVEISCTQQQYYNYITAEIDRLKKSYFQSQEQFRKNRWLMSCKQRLDWMTTLKEDFVLEMLKMLDDYRTLTFCTFIEQTKRLGDYPINSEDKKQSAKNLADFNAGIISHITSAAILNEGVNLANCQVGIYANIGASKVVECQRLGRILRHNNPLIIIPFFTGTREEELVDKMLANYNPDLIIKLFKSQITKEVLEEILNGKGNIQQIVSG